MSILQVTAGMKLSIGPAMALKSDDLTAADFNGVSWTHVSGTTNMGNAGDSSNLITSDHTDSKRTKKGKGTRNAGSMEILADLDGGDPGQIAIYAAEKTNDNHAFRLQFDDAPAGGTPSTRYFLALVMGATEQYDEANSAIKLATTLELNSNVVRVPASAGGGA